MILSQLWPRPLLVSEQMHPSLPIGLVLLLLWFIIMTPAYMSQFACVLLICSYFDGEMTALFDVVVYLSQFLQGTVLIITDNAVALHKALDVLPHSSFLPAYRSAKNLMPGFCIHLTMPFNYAGFPVTWAFPLMIGLIH